MREIFDDNYLIENNSARTIYDAIKDMPIYDYHSHLDTREIYEDKVYSDIAELWLSGDHYKWRLMREAGVSEDYITGNRSGYEKFRAFARILPLFIGNPVYEWAHLELRRYFGINMPINERNAQHIWNESQRIIAERHYSPRTLLHMARVDTLMTTDDPLSDLEYHKKLREEGYDIRVIPTFRPDKVLALDGEAFVHYIEQLSVVTDTKICDITSLTNALEARLCYFVEMDCTIADISVIDVPNVAERDVADRALVKALLGEDITSEEKNAYVYQMLLEIAKMLSKYDIVMQLHIGAIRNQNSRRYTALGADSGIDSIADVMNIASLGRWMDTLNNEGMLPRSIYYSHNESVYYPLSAMINNFAGDSRGKVQLGAAWWMMDCRQGIERQLEAFKNTAGIGYFNGMLTDSRSFTSFVRHDYFRRVLASFLGTIVENGGAYLDEDMLDIAKNIAFYNARDFFSKEDTI